MADWRIMPSRPPTFVIHGLADARAAAAAAAEAGIAIRLLSAPGAAAYGGAGWFREIAAAIHAEFPGLAVEAVLDCGDAPGHALAALRAGIAAIRFDGPKRVRDKIAAIAHQCDAVLDAGGGKALDLGEVADRDSACRAWLGR